MVEKKTLELLVRIWAVIITILGAISLVVAFAAIGLSSLIEAAAPQLVPLVGAGILTGILLLALALLRITVGWGLWNFEKWAWKLAMFFLLVDVAIAVATSNYNLLFILDVLKAGFLLYVAKPVFDIDVFRLNKFEYISGVGTPMAILLFAMATNVIALPASIVMPAASVIPGGEVTVAPAAEPASIQAGIDFTKMSVLLSGLGLAISFFSSPALQRLWEA